MLFSVSDLKEEKLIKKQTYMKTETCILYSRDFWIFLPNIIKIDRYNFELYRFKVGPFLLRHSVYSCASACKNSCCMSPVISSFLREAVDILFSFLSHSCAVILCFRSDMAFREMLLRFCWHLVCCWYELRAAMLTYTPTELFSMRHYEPPRRAVLQVYF